MKKETELVPGVTKRQMEVVLHSPRIQFHLLSSSTRCEYPHPDKVAALRKLLDEHPDLWREFGDLARTSVDNLIEAAGDNAGWRESVKRAVDHLKEDLGWRRASPLERLAIEQVVLAWVGLYCAQDSYSRTVYGSGGTTHAMVERWDKLLTQAQRRHMRAMESLARIRKLSRGIDFVQVNIATDGGQQINVTGNVGANQEESFLMRE